MLAFSNATFAATTFYWEADCTSGCTGTASGVLTLVDTYVPGDPFTESDFISWEYTSSSGRLFFPAKTPGPTLIFGEPSAFPGSGLNSLEVILFRDLNTFTYTQMGAREGGLPLSEGGTTCDSSFFCSSNFRDTFVNGWFTDADTAGSTSILTLEVSDTSLAPGDSVLVSGTLVVDEGEAVPLPDRPIQIKLTLPDETVLQAVIDTGEDGKFEGIIPGQLFTQQGAHLIDARFDGEDCDKYYLEGVYNEIDVCNVNPSTASADVSVVGAVQLRTPIENLQVFTSVPFSWEAYLGRSDVLYDLVIALDPDFERVVTLKSKLTTPSALLSLETGTQYYWRVDVFLSTGAIESSGVSSFLTSLGNSFAGIVTGLVTSNQAAAGINGASVDTTFDIVGDVTETSSPNILVTISHPNDANQKGYYIFYTLDSGTKNVTVSAADHQTRTVSVSVPEGQQGPDVVPVRADIELMAEPAATPPLPGTYTMTGVTRHAIGRTPLGALVLANGEFVFTQFNAGQDSGRFSLRNVPLESDGTIRLFAFADGFSPYYKDFLPGGAGGQIGPEEVLMNRPAGNVPSMTVSRTVEAAGSNRINISGSVRNDAGTGLGALILVNGQHMFSQFNEGTFSLMNVPLDASGRFTFFAFAFGFAPYKETSLPETSDAQSADADGGP